jgi:hypothetical protein
MATPALDLSQITEPRINSAAAGAPTNAGRIDLRDRESRPQDPQSHEPRHSSQDGQRAFGSEIKGRHFNFGFSRSEIKGLFTFVAGHIARGGDVPVAFISRKEAN